jgi:hypothetical protein
MIRINFNNITNDSLQVGDNAYFVTPSGLGGFNTSIDQNTGVDQLPTLIGEIVNITNDSITVDDDGINIPNNEDFIMFAKDTSVNLSGLTGYYAEVKLINNSTEEAEIFSLSSDVSASSK